MQVKYKLFRLFTRDARGPLDTRDFSDLVEAVESYNFAKNDRDLASGELIGFDADQVPELLAVFAGPDSSIGRV